MSDDRSRFGAADDTPIDRAIDRAVREMMRVDPPAGLRRRVLSRIDTPPRRWILLPRLAAAAAALVLVVTAALVMRRDTATPPTAPTAAVASNVPTQVERPAPPAPAPPAMGAVRQAGGASRTPRREAIRMPRIENVFGSPTAAGRLSATSVAEPESAPVDVPESPASRDGQILEPAPIIIPEITIAPLRIEQLGINPVRRPM